MPDTKTVSLVRAYPLILTATRSRENDAEPWGSLHFEMSYEDKTEVSLSEEGAKLFAWFVRDTIEKQAPPKVAAD